MNRNSTCVFISHSWDEFSSSRSGRGGGRKSRDCLGSFGHSPTHMSSARPWRTVYVRPCARVNEWIRFFFSCSVAEWMGLGLPFSRLRPPAYGGQPFLSWHRNPFCLRQVTRKERKTSGWRNEIRCGRITAKCEVEKRVDSAAGAANFWFRSLVAACNASNFAIAMRISTRKLRGLRPMSSRSRTSITLLVLQLPLSRCAGRNDYDGDFHRRNPKTGTFHSFLVFTQKTRKSYTPRQSDDR